MPSPDDTHAAVQDLLDRAAIRELTARYNDAWDDGDPAQVAAAFTEDGVIEMVDGPTLCGREQIRAAAVRSHRDLVHMTTDPVTEVDGDRAVQRSRVLLVRCGPHDPIASVAATGRYVDTVVRRPEGWLFERRVVALKSSPAA